MEIDSLSEPAWTHPALSLSHGLSHDIFPDLFEWIFIHPVFERWSGEPVNWQLYCVGHPGAGKTTLAAVVARRLKDRFHSAGYPVIPVFVREDVTTYEHEFLEDLLHVVYQGLGRWKGYNEFGSKKNYADYVKARFGLDEGCRINRRLDLIRKALHRRLEVRGEDTRIFLIIDGMDLCSQTLLLLLETELSQLRGLGVSLLLTSRIPVFEQDVFHCDHLKHTEIDPDEDVQADGEDNMDEEADEPMDEQGRRNEDMFYTCESCSSILCLGCKAAERTCDSNICTAKGPMRELYDHVNITVSVPDVDMENYIAWNLEREHGNLGLNSSARMPPLSSLGLAIRNSKDTEMAKNIVGNIKGLSAGHVATAKARLDLVQDARSVDDLLQRRYQLPANILAMFDAAVKTVENQNPLQRSLGLHAIAAAGRDSNGIEISDLRTLLEKSNSTRVRSGEDILRAARGFLIAAVGDKPQKVELFENSFYNYVVERYNKSIYHANLELPQDELLEEEGYFDSAPPEQGGSISQVTSAESTPVTSPVLLQKRDTGGSQSPGSFGIVRKGTRMWS